jgi:hypothetical protein
MAALNHNVIHLTFDGVEVCDALFVNVDFNPTNSVQDVTAGCGAEHVMRAPGLDDYKMSVTLMYDITKIDDYIQKLKPGAIIAVEYGPEGNVSGKPRHVQDFIVGGSSHSRNVTKTKTEFSIDLQGAGAPSINLYDGAVYP